MSYEYENVKIREKLALYDEAKNENDLVLSICHEIERLASVYISESTDIQRDYRSRLEKINDDFEENSKKIKSESDSNRERINSDYENNLSAIKSEYALQSAKFEQDSKEILAQIGMQYQNLKEKMIKRKNITINRILDQRKSLNDYMLKFEEAESMIATKDFKKIKSNIENELLPNVATNDLKEIMSRYPKFMATKISELQKNRLIRFFRPSLLRKKYLEFLSLKNKAQQLYNEALKAQNNVLSTYQAEFAAELADFETKEKIELKKIEEEENQKIRSCKDTFEDQLNNLKREHDLQISELEEDTKNKISKLSTQHEEQLNSLENKLRNDLESAEEKYRKGHIANLPPDIIKSFINKMTIRKVRDAQSFVPAQDEPFNVTVGNVYFNFKLYLQNEIIKQCFEENYSFILNNNDIVFPYAIAINEHFSLWYEYKQNEAKNAILDMQTLCMNIFLATPPNKMRFYFIDPLQAGRTFAVFNNLEDNNIAGSNVIMGNGILTNEKDIETQLRILVDHINTMVGATFRGAYNNIRDYNADNILNPQPYHILGIMDFPTRFNQEAFESLKTIVTSGKTCGVYVILMSSENLIKNVDQRYKNIVAQIKNQCECFKGHFKESESKISYFIDTPLAVSEIEKIAPVMKKAIKDAGKLTIPYDVIAPTPEEYFTFNVDEGLSIPIGLSGARDVLSVELGRPGSQSVHALICGQTGSGKSRLLHAVIIGALLKYPPEELMIYLVDFKSGTEFKTYADYNIPNIKVIALESEPEFGVSVLRALKDEKERRSQIFNANSVEDIFSYNKTPEAKSGGRLPQVLIVMDEFHKLFSSQDTNADEAKMFMDDILRLDRNVGFHIILCSQSLRNTHEINDAALAQIAVRIALKCPKEDASIVLGQEADAIDQVEENDAGSAIFVPAISTARSVKFRVGFLTGTRQTEILLTIYDYYRKKGVQADTRILSSNVSDSPNNVFQRYWKNGDIVTKDRVLHLGESMRVVSNLEVRFTNASGNNLLFLGHNVQKAQDMLSFVTLELILQKIGHIRSGISPININVINYCDGADVNLIDNLKKLGTSASECNYVNYYSGENADNGLKNIYKSFDEKTEDSPDEWFVLSNLALASDDLDRDDYFHKVLEEGPEKGFFTVVWCDEPILCEDILKNDDLRSEFSKRVVFNISSEQALKFAQVVNDESINKNNAYIYQNRKGKEKFRPYATPLESWVTSLCKKMRLEERKNS